MQQEPEACHSLISHCQLRGAKILQGSLSSSLPSFSGSCLVTFSFAGSEFCNWFSLFVSLYDPGPLIALSSLGTKGFRRPYITGTLPELRVLQKRSCRWVWVWTGGICLQTQICLPKSSKTFGCLQSGSKADQGRWSQHYFLLISSNNIPHRNEPLSDPCVYVCQELVFTHNDSSARCVGWPSGVLFFSPSREPRRANTRSPIVLWLLDYITQCHINYLYAICVQGHALSDSPSHVRMKDKWQRHTLQICQPDASTG